MFKEVTTESMEKAVASYLSIISQDPEEVESVDVDTGTLQQMALLASVTMSRQLLEKL